jgi:hypothetical protein
LKSHSNFKQYERWDIMKHYRESIHDDDSSEIFKEVVQHESDIEVKQEVIISSKKLVKSRRIPGQK